MSLIVIFLEAVLERRQALLFVLEFPITDFRCILHSPYKLQRPFWPVPAAGDMQKSIGSIDRRKKGGVRSWGGEAIHSSARQAVHYPELSKFFIETGSRHRLITEGAFRRFYSDGKFFAKYELGLSNNFENILHDIDPLAQPVITGQILRDYISIPIHIPHPSYNKTAIPLWQAGTALSQLFLYSSHSAADNRAGNTNVDHVASGPPVCVVEFDGSIPESALPAGVYEIPGLAGGAVSVYHMWIRLEQRNDIRVWFIRKNGESAETDKLARELRLNLLRLHAEKDMVKNLFALLEKHSRKNTTAAELQPEGMIVLGQRLETLTSNLLRQTRFGLPQDDILPFVLQLEEFAVPGELDIYLDLARQLQNVYVETNIRKLHSITTNVVVQGGKVDSINVTEKGDVIINGNKN
ncbi:MAG: hypothetical protein LWX56_11485 [Ignavibacteria bacterium]|nr:hypothetical protein [Ignavibacteria bacterium]